MVTANQIVQLCNVPEGRSNAELQPLTGLMPKDLGSRLSTLVAAGRLVKNKKFGGAMRYYVSNSAMQAHCYTENVARRAAHIAPPPAPTVVVPKSVQITRGVTAPEQARPVIRIPTDTGVTIRAGADDFRAVPSLSTFDRGTR